MCVHLLTRSAMSEPPNLTAHKCAVLLNKRLVTEADWMDFIEDNWQDLTANLNNETFLILAGRHGNPDGSIGPEDDSVVKHHENMVQQFLKIVLLSHVMSYNSIFRRKLYERIFQMKSNSKTSESSFLMLLSSLKMINFNVKN